MKQKTKSFLINFLFINFSPIMQLVHFQWTELLSCAKTLWCGAVSFVLNFPELRSVRLGDLFVFFERFNEQFVGERRMENHFRI